MTLNKDRLNTKIVQDRYETLTLCIEEAFVTHFKEYADYCRSSLIDERVQCVSDEVKAFRAGAKAVAMCLGDYFTPDVVDNVIAKLEASLLLRIRR